MEAGIPFCLEFCEKAIKYTFAFCARMLSECATVKKIPHDILSVENERGEYI